MTEFEKRLTKFIKIMESLHAQGVERINPKWAREQMQRLREAFSDEEADRPCPHCEGKGYFDFGMKAIRLRWCRVLWLQWHRGSGCGSSRQGE